MPQLDTSTWFITALSSTATLFILLQLKFSNIYYFNAPTPKTLKSLKTENPWEMKWTKIYSPHSLPPH
uniref:ATP synthase complex subunit 8 n=1 Tax=Acomys cahirinus TaxID=10068 RepID=G5D5V8_ACOCA|nr:ATP synthase F0 subunit 8 [Acomys cahirinus]AEP83278.1 ATP synthase F0 subunit 8 [Acomys cahirinus]AEP83291.1 ATP synthase F0 subunit 8 [Acomys cahirinus]AEP83304.1 ATP synthase F0 subunit 8 [Acomys cahirinus]AEP83317.1 ATP synthase F0 subunit 8 [Acomys cahirinus]